ncbi:hypothetical protein SAMN05421874_105192 [Nonomuraea maritima]|uniref:Uncharacterized protein n=1 Tax=Nonomuraea maritima TaxID=683260 RepID=A0A1G8ZAI8_9ACTN|nr:hypothetical protein SAMN05421874_105192 [Nonomuraea maritima]
MLVVEEGAAGVAGAYAGWEFDVQFGQQATEFQQFGASGISGLDQSAFFADEQFVVQLLGRAEVGEFLFHRGEGPGVRAQASFLGGHVLLIPYGDRVELVLGLPY